MGSTSIVKPIPGNSQLTIFELGIDRNNFQTVGRCWQFLCEKQPISPKSPKNGQKKWFLAISSPLQESQKLPGITIWHFLKTFGQILKMTQVSGNFKLSIYRKEIARNYLHFESAATSWQFLSYIQRARNRQDVVAFYGFDRNHFHGESRSCRFPAHSNCVFKTLPG